MTLTFQSDKWIAAIDATCIAEFDSFDSVKAWYDAQPKSIKIYHNGKHLDVDKSAVCIMMREEFETL